MKVIFHCHMLILGIAAVLGSRTAAMAAQDVRVGSATFAIPDGWQLGSGVPEEQGKLLVLPNAAGGPPKALLMILRDAELKGPFKEAFAQAVAAAGQSRKARQTGEVLAAKDPKGNPLLAQSLLYEDGTYISFLAAQVGQRMQLVFCLTSDAQALRQLVRTEFDLVAGMRLADAPVAANAPSNSAPPSATPAADEGKFRAGDVAGVWMGFIQYIGSYQPRPRWHTFFEDGQAYLDLPRAGLRGFDRAASKADKNQLPYWGAYRYRDGSGVIERPGVPVIKITATKPGQIKLDSTDYFRCVDVDGLRLDGAWTTYANPDDPALMKLPAGQRPIFSFHKDGSFTDEGVFASILKTYGEKTSDAAGSGAYDIKDFTLTLRYTDGRVRTVCITGFLSADPANNDKIVCISRMEFHKMK